jgi:hypothetical protein
MGFHFECTPDSIMPQDKSLHQEFETRLAELVEQFDRHRADYVRPDYSEAQARLDFINPFFEALGWDIRNKAGLGSKEREVVVEQGETFGRPDYGFRLNGRTVFFVEAKAPHVLLDRTDVIIQAKSYAWNSPDVFISAVTDFEEFRTYDTTAKPDRKHPDAGLIFAYRYTDYLRPKTLDDLWLLSKESVTGGSIDRLLKMSSVKAHQRIPVDRAFLDDLTGWREKLAKAVYKAGPDWAVADLNSVVQVFLDRLIFIRIAEDRGILPPRELEDIAGAWKLSGKRRSIVNDLNALFHEVNGLLNGEIFKPHLCEKVDWDQSADLVVDIINKLYPPESLYRFDVIGVELLGSIYERYLGKTIRVTATRAVVEDKPEVRKAGGVYYTPKYVVDYIVEQTVGKLIEGKTPAQIAKLKILDPACGSGSFLLGAYQKLLDYHTRYYAERAYRRGAQSAAPQARLIRDGEGGEFKLTLSQKAEILRNNIYGVDIDPQAVEITMMSLYIKLLEGERGLMINHAVLPPLRDNIKCGNSLIEHDIVHQPDLLAEGELTPEDLNRINPFDWGSKGEGFGGIMAAGGFDVILGNPPYGATFSEQELAYLQARFKGESRSYDSYELFLLKASRLLRSGGRLSMIIPASWLTGEKYQMSRQSLLKSLAPSVAYAMPFDVFKEAYIDTAIVVLARTRATQDCLIHYFPKKEKLASIPDGIGTVVPIESIRNDPLSRLSVVLSQKAAPVLAKLKTAPLTFGDWFEIQRGVQPYSRKKHSEDQISKRFLHATSRRSKEYLPELQGNELSRYWIQPERASFLRYCDDIASTRSMKMFQGERIVLRRLLTRKFRLQASMTAETMITTDNVLNIVPRSSEASVAFALGLLNSKLMSWFYVNTSMVAQKDDFPQVHISALAALSIPQFDPARRDKMVMLVERMLELHQQKQAAQSEATQARIEREIHVTDEQIDALVYELYGLTGDEIKIVEGTP